MLNGLKSLVGLVLVCALISVHGSLIADDEISKAMRAQGCLHSKPPGDIDFIFEEWINLGDQFHAIRVPGGNQFPPQVLFFDLKSKILSKYFEKENTIYRLPESSEPPGARQTFLRHLCGLVTGDSKGFPYFQWRSVEQSRRTVQDANRSFIEIELKCADAGNLDALPTTSMTVRVDPKTNLPGSVSWTNKGGNLKTVSIDYPDPTPTSILDLGVPPTATVIDRVPSEEIESIVAAFKAGRFAFDDYCAYRVEESGFSGKYFSQPTPYRIWRKGSNWRVERLVPTGGTTKPVAKNRPLEAKLPKDVDLAWFKSHQSDFHAVPEGMGNGTTNWFIQLSDDWMPGSPIEPKNVTREKIRRPVDNPYPVAGQEKLPEHAGHPAWHVWPPGPDCELVLDPKPGEGPPNTILLVCRNTNKDWPAITSHCRFWLDPDADYLARRSEFIVHDNQATTKIAWTNITEIEASNVSPQGIAYPTKIREYGIDTQKAITFDRRYSYHVDFEAEIADELFDPPN